MKARSQLALAILGVAALALSAPAADDKKPEAKRPRVEVVFCLDTIGSMGEGTKGSGVD